LAPNTTQFGAAPTRSAIARRALSTVAAARSERADCDPGCAGDDRRVVMIARITVSGCRALKFPSR